jgi:hypothetical protein
VYSCRRLLAAERREARRPITTAAHAATRMIEPSIDVWSLTRTEGGEGALDGHVCVVGLGAKMSCCYGPDMIMTVVVMMMMMIMMMIMIGTDLVEHALRRGLGVLAGREHRPLVRAREQLHVGLRLLRLVAAWRGRAS